MVIWCLCDRRRAISHVRRAPPPPHQGLSMSSYKVCKMFMLIYGVYEFFDRYGFNAYFANDDATCEVADISGFGG